MFFKRESRATAERMLSYNNTDSFKESQQLQNFSQALARDIDKMTKNNEK